MQMPVAITVIGSGYVGLVSGACLADWGHDVTMVDTNRDRIAQLNRNCVPIHEPGLEELLSQCRSRGRIRFTTDLSGAVADSQCVMIAVGTPSDPLTGDADLSQVMACADQIAKSLICGRELTVVIKSTVPPGTNERVESRMRRLRPDVTIDVASNPEFLREGSAIRDFQQPDRIVIGTGHMRARQVLDAIYAPLTTKGVPVIATDRKSAETIKYAANAFLAMKVAFINQIADFCEAFGADIGSVAQGVGTDKRIGQAFLNPGPGYGGSCFPKDTSALVNAARDIGVNLSIVAETIQANDRRKRAMASRIQALLGRPLDETRIAVLGLTFKANTNDLRDSPAISLVRALAMAGAEVCAFDPQVRPDFGPLYGITIENDVLSCADGADVIVIATEWPEFASLDFDHLASLVRNPLIVDLRRVVDRAAAEKAGFRLSRLGEARGRSLAKPKGETPAKPPKVARVISLSGKRFRPVDTDQKTRLAKIWKRDEGAGEKDTGVTTR